MALTIGNSPFGNGKNGKFNFKFDSSGTVLYWEDFLKRVRVEFNGKIIADSRKVKALHETGKPMVLYFPREDVEMDKLNPTEHQTKCPHKGTASYWSVKIGEKTAENVVWSYENPIESVIFIKGYISFVYHKMDAWYQEDEKIYAHPQNPYHRFDVHKSSQHVVVRKDGKTIADSKNPVLLFETGLPIRYYLPPEDVEKDGLKKSRTMSRCPYKGDGQHWHLEMGGNSYKDVAWSLPNPIGEAKDIKDYVCFYPEKVDIEVDGEIIEK